MSSHIDTVQQIYAAFGSGDIPGILERLDADVEWEYDLQPNDIPWLRPGRGRDHVAAFFGAVGEYMEFQRFEPLNLLEGGGAVMAVVAEEIRIKPTGKVITDLGAHLWTFGPGGRVTRFRHFVDTLQHHEALRK